MILFAGSISRRGLLLGPVGCFAFKATRSRRLQLLCTEALLGWGLQALIQKLEQDVLPKIEGQIAELNKADEPTDTTRAIKDQLEVGHWSRIRGMHRFLCMASNLLVSALTPVKTGPHEVILHAGHEGQHNTVADRCPRRQQRGHSAGCHWSSEHLCRSQGGNPQTQWRQRIRLNVPP